MEGIRSKKRLVLAALITIATLFGVQQAHGKREAVLPSANTADHTPSATAPTPSKPLVWVMGSILAGLVGLTRFGTDQH